MRLEPGGDAPTGHRAKMEKEKTTRQRYVVERWRHKGESSLPGARKDEGTCLDPS